MTRTQDGKLLLLTVMANSSKFHLLTLSVQSKEDLMSAILLTRLSIRLQSKSRRSTRESM